MKYMDCSVTEAKIQCTTYGLVVEDKVLKIFASVIPHKSAEQLSSIVFL